MFLFIMSKNAVKSLLRYALKSTFIILFCASDEKSSFPESILQVILQKNKTELSKSNTMQRENIVTPT